MLLGVLGLGLARGGCLVSNGYGFWGFLSWFSIERRGAWTKAANGTKNPKKCQKVHLLTAETVFQLSKKVYLVILLVVVSYIIRPVFQYNQAENATTEHP